MSCQISIVIPAYNEESRLPATLESVYAYMCSRKRSFEILVVDDGSTDGTAAYVESFVAAAKSEDKEISGRPSGLAEVRLISYKPNRGKGHAVRTGVLAARGDYILFNDADGSSPIEESEKLEAALAGGYELAIGSRAKPSAERKVNALAYRKYIGNTFNMIVQSLLLPGIHDTQCGFKMFKQQIAQDIFSVCKQDGFAFDVEVLYVARLRGYKCQEIPINWSNVDGSKVNVFFDSQKMLIDVLRIWVGAWTGRYRKLGNQSTRA